MYSNIRLYPLILVLAVLLTFSGGWASKAEGSSFPDTAEAEWAHQAISEMTASEVLYGYPDGGFKPYNNVTKLEAVAMLIRVLGQEDQAKAAEEAGVDYEMPPDLNWGSGYLIMAVKRGMLDEDYLYLLQPNAPATRTEVAMLVFHALKLSPESGAMDFEDAGEVPAEYREGVAAVVKNSIMKGLPGNVFKPNDEINRAQMAVLMSNIVKLKYADPCPDRRSKGDISAIDPDSRIITIKSTGSIFYTSNCEVFLGGVSISPDELRAGDKAELILDDNRHAVFISALRSSIGQKYKGTVSSLQTISGVFWLSIILEDDQELTRLVADDVKVNESGSLVNVSALSNGDSIEILVSENKIIRIDSLKGYNSLEGIISDLDTTGTWGITIRDDDGDTTKYVAVEAVVVRRNDSSIDFDDLEEEERVKLELNSNGLVYYIEVLESASDQLEGEIRDIDTIGTLGIVIRNDNGDRKEYVVIDAVEVERDSDSIDFDDLDKGEWARLKLDSRGRVYYIEVTDEEFSYIEGTVNELVTGSSPFIRIARSGSTRVQYDIDDNADYFKDGDRIDLEDIVIGSEIKARVSEDDIITWIEVTNDEDIKLEGTVIYVNESDEKIRIEQASGNRFTYSLADDPILKDTDGHNIDLEDIEEDSEVRIVLEDGEITRLTVL